MSAAVDLRSSAIVAGELERKRTRRDALQYRQGEVATELEALRVREARALADGDPTDTPSPIHALATEQQGLTRALQMLADDLTTLEAELAAVKVSEAAGGEAHAANTATIALDALETTLRATITTHVLPAADAFHEAFSTLRRAVMVTDDAQRRAGTLPENSDGRRAHNVANRRTRLLTLVETLREFVGSAAA